MLYVPEAPGTIVLEATLAIEDEDRGIYPFLQQVIAKAKTRAAGAEYDVLVPFSQRPVQEARLAGGIAASLSGRRSLSRAYSVRGVQ
jgi:hypothetical protein